jgi:hypothetical protein
MVAYTWTHVTWSFWLKLMKVQNENEPFWKHVSSSFGAPSAVPIATARVERGGAEHVGNVRCRGDAALGAERVHLAPSRDQTGILGAHDNHGHAGVGVAGHAAGGAHLG